MCSTWKPCRQFVRHFLTLRGWYGSRLVAQNYASSTEHERVMPLRHRGTRNSCYTVARGWRPARGGTPAPPILAILQNLQSSNSPIASYRSVINNSKNVVDI